MRQLLTILCLPLLMLVLATQQVNAVGPFELTVDQVRGQGDTLFLEFYIQSTSANPIDWFALGNTNLVVNTSAGIDLSNVGIRSLTADSGVFNTSAYQTIQVSGQPVFGFINLTIVQSVFGGPGTQIDNTQRYLAARVYTLITDCNATSALTWNATGSLREYGTFLNLQPLATRVPPNPLFLGADISVGPGLACFNDQLVGYSANGPGDWELHTSLLSLSSFAGVPSLTDTATVNFSNPSVTPLEDTLIFILGSCRDTFLVTVNPQPLITGSTPVCSQDLGVVYNAAVPLGTFTLISSIGSTLFQFGSTATIDFGFAAVATRDTIIFQDPGGCRDTFVVDVNPAPTPLILGPASVSYFGNDSIYSATPFNLGNTYVWSTSVNASIDSITPLTDSIFVDFTLPGQDTVFVQEVDLLNGCVGRDTFLVDVVCPQSTITGIDTVCEFSGPFVFTNSFPVVTWSTSGASISILASTANDVTLQFGDAPPPDVLDTLFADFLGGCRDTFLVHVFDNSTINVIVGSDTADFLAQDSLYFITPQVNHIYTWEVIGQGVLDSIFPTGDSILVDFLFVGDAFVILHDSNTSSTCTRSDTLRVGVGGCATGQIVGDTIVCSQELAKTYFHPEPSSAWNLVSSIGSSIVFGGVGNVAIIDFGITAASVTDSLFVTFAGSCIDTVLIEVRPPPTILNPTIDSTLCQYDTLTLSSDFAGIWWRVEDGLLIQLTPDTNQVSITYNSVPTDIDTILIQVGACQAIRELTIDSVPSLIITGPSPVAVPSPPVNYSVPLVATYSYTWGISLSGASTLAPAANLVDVTFNLPGFDTLEVVTTDLNTGCVGRDSLVIEVVPCAADAGIVSTDTVVCAGSLAIPYIYSNNGLIIQWQDSTTASGAWTNEGGPFQNSQVLIHFPLDTTYFRAIVSDGLCSDTSLVTRVDVSVAAIAGTASLLVPDTICANTTAQIQLAGFQADSIEWEESPDGILFWTPVPTSNTPLLSVIPVVGVTYYRAHIYTGCGTAISNIVSVVVSDSAIGGYTSILDSLCQNVPTGPLGATLVNGLGFWTSTGLGGFNQPNDPNSEYVPHPLDAGLDIALIWNVVSPGCPSVSDSDSVYIAPLPNGTFNTTIDPLCVGDTTVALGATVLSGTGYWFTSSGQMTGFIDPLDPNTNYASSAPDGGFIVDLQWIVSTGTVCPNDTNAQSILVGTPPSATFNQALPSICAGSPTDTLRAFNLIGSGTWASNGAGFFNIIDDTTAIYFSDFSDADSLLTISFIASSGGCPVESYNQFMVVDSASLGDWTTVLDSICAGVNTVPLNATAISGIGRWETDGFGYFYPDSLDPAARYYSDTLDAGNDVTISWIVSNGSCTPDTISQTFNVKSTKVFGLFDVPIPDICLTDTTIPLGASVLYGTGSWLAPQGGTFLDPLDPNTQYVPDISVAGDTATLVWEISVPGCSNLDLEQQIFVFAPPQGIFGPTSLSPVCLGDSTQLFFGQITIGTNSFWTTTGAGSFTSSTASPNRYTPVLADAGDTIDICYVVQNGLCPDLNICKPLVVSQQPGATFPGPLNNTCAGALSDPLNATVVNGVGVWSCIGCAGTFSSLTDPNAVYNSDLPDAGNTITIVWTTSSPGCPDSVLSQNLFIDPILIDGDWLTPPSPICFSDTTAPFGASVTIGVHSWLTTGLGTFINAANPALTQYVPATGEGGDTILITFQVSDAGGICNSYDVVYPLVIDTFGQGSIFGVADTVCFPDTSAIFAGSTVYGNSFWQSGGGPGSQFIPSPDSATIRFVPSPVDAGFTVPLLWISETSACPNDTDSITVRVDPIPFGAFIQNMFPICAGGMTNPLNGVAFTGVGHWATTGQGSFVPDIFTPNARYQSVQAEAGDTIDLIWVIESGVCTPDTHIKSLVIRNNITDGVWAGLPNSIICCGDTTAPLNATVNVGLGFWTSSIPGAFLPNDQDPNAQFEPSNLACGDTVFIQWNVQDSSGLCQLLTIEDTLQVNNPGLGGIATPAPSQVCVGDTTDFYTGLVALGVGHWDCPNCLGNFTDTFATSTQYVTSFADVGVDPLSINWLVETPGCAPTVYTRLLAVNDSSDGTFPPIVPDTICAGTSTNIFGATTNFGAGVWGCDNCDGAFQNPFSGNARYISTILDGGNTIDIHWVVTNGACPPDSNTQQLFVNEIPSGNIGIPPPQFCEGTVSDSLQGITFSGIGFWTVIGGSGTFTDPLDPFAQYISAVGDADTTTIVVWNITNPPGCDTIQFTRVLNIQNLPEVVGDTSLLSVCVGNFSPQLGLVPIHGQGLWYTSGNGFFADPTNGNTIYFASPLDAGDTVTLSFRVGNFPCDSIDFTRRVVHLGGGAVAATILSPTADTTVCVLTDIPLVAGGGGNFFWQANAGLLSSNNGDSVSVSYPTAVIGGIIALTSTDSATGCVSRDTVLITALDGLGIDVTVGGNVVTDYQYCQGDSVQPVVIGGTANWEWTTPSGAVPYTVANPNIRDTVTTIYNITAQTGNGCPSSTVFVVNVIPFQQVEIIGDDFCETDTTIFQVLNGGACTTLSWAQGSISDVLANGGYNNPANPLILPGFLNQDTVDLTNLTSNNYVYSISCFNATTGCTANRELDFRVIPYPVADFTADNNLLPYDDGTTTPRTVNFTDLSTNATYWFWFFDDVNSPDSTSLVQNPIHQFSGPGLFTIALFVQNELGCGHIRIKSDFIEVLEQEYYFPTAFSPNEDGLNDRFRALPVGSARMQTMEIYDRWGVKVFTTDNVNGWDGNNEDGRPFDPGNYLYRVVIELDTRGLVEYRGYVTLIR